VAQRQPELGERIKAIIKQSGDSYYDAGDKLGVSQTAVWKMTRGDFSRQLLERFVEVYGGNRTEWMRAAGYETETGEQRFYRGLRELTKKYRLRTVPTAWFQQGAETLTVEQADQYLAAIERNIDALRPDPEPNAIPAQIPREGE